MNYSSATPISGLKVSCFLLASALPERKLPLVPDTILMTPAIFLDVTSPIIILLLELVIERNHSGQLESSLKIFSQTKPNLL